MIETTGNNISKFTALRKQLADWGIKDVLAVTQAKLTEITNRATREFEVYYVDSSGDYRAKDNSGRWIRLYPHSLQLHAAVRFGISSKRPKDAELSPFDRFLVDVQMNKAVAYGGAVAGFKEGLFSMGGRQVLVTESPRLIAPTSGDWSTIKAVIEGGLGHTPAQLGCLYGWLKTAVYAVYGSHHQPGQAIAFCGPREAGKSLVQKLITLMLGGREARPYQYMIGQTRFNAELFGAEHLVIEDENASTDRRNRRHFSSFLKAITANETGQCEAKGQTPVTLSPIRRLSISVNNEPQNLMVLPELDESIEDKIILLKFEKMPMPVRIDCPADREIFWNKLRTELPHFLHYLGEFEIPAEMKNPRFGVKHYHHPDILDSLDTLSLEKRLLSLIDMVLFHNMVSEDEASASWTGEAVELERKLRKDEVVGRETDRILTYNSACGYLLSRLASKHPERFSERRVRGTRYWTIKPPNAPFT